MEPTHQARLVVTGRRLRSTAERREVVFAQQQFGAGVHRVDIELDRDVPVVRASSGFGDGSFHTS
jgi:hypothetical protein